MADLPCTVIVPAAGDSVRFTAKTQIPKGLVFMRHDNIWAPMIKHVVRGGTGDVIVGVKPARMTQFQTRLGRRFKVIPVPYSTGQGDTVWWLAHYAARERDVLVVNCDNAFAPGVLSQFVAQCRFDEASCGAVVFKPNGNLERYGYVDGYPRFTKGAEKVPISAYALAGAFYFKNPGIITAFCGPAGYVSNWFEKIPRPKVSYLITAEQFYEWGTPEDLEKSVGLGGVAWEF